ncbi:MAG: hypothetical protein ACRD6N_17210 [Pyrinomonadaceae bacterium]
MAADFAAFFRDAVAFAAFLPDGFAATARFAFGRADFAPIVRLLTEVLAEDRRALDADLLNPFATGLLICGKIKTLTAVR